MTAHPKPSVTQADRDAAAEVLGMYESMSNRQRTLDGSLDMHPVMDLFVAHRQSAEAASRAEVERLLAAVDALGLRQLVAGWNGENRPDGPYEPHPAKLGVTLRTNAGQVYELDAAAEAVRAALSASDGEGCDG